MNADGKGCAATDTGKLDFSHISVCSTRKFYFAQGEPALPSGYVLPEPVEETPRRRRSAGETAEGTATDGMTRQRAKPPRCRCRNTNDTPQSRQAPKPDTATDPAAGTPSGGRKPHGPQM